MKKVLSLLLVSSFAITIYAQTAADKEAVNNVATSFLNSWNMHDFKNMSSYTTEDVYFINPVGMWWKGRADVQKAFQHMHQTFLKNVAMTNESPEIHFVTPTVALINTISKVGTYYPPDGVDNGHNKMGDDRGIETLVVVKRNGKWLLAAGQVTGINDKATNGDPLKQTTSIKSQQ